jgi:hypothetical protein
MESILNEVRYFNDEIMKHDSKDLLSNIASLKIDFIREQLKARGYTTSKDGKRMNNKKDLKLLLEYALKTELKEDCSIDILKLVLYKEEKRGARAGVPQPRQKKRKIMSSPSDAPDSNESEPEHNDTCRDQTMENATGNPPLEIEPSHDLGMSEGIPDGHHERKIKPLDKTEGPMLHNFTQYKFLY